MGRRTVEIHLPKASHFFANCLFTLPPYENGKSELELDLLLERNLRAGEQAHRHVWFSHGGKTARDRVVELRRYEFVSDLCGSGRHMVQAVVAHLRNSSPCKPGFLQMTSEVTRMVANF